MANIFCHKCGSKLEKEQDACVSCGANVSIKLNDIETSSTTQNSNRINLETKVWYRALKVFYIAVISVLFCIIAESHWFSVPSKTINDKKSSIVCGNGKSYAPGQTQINIWRFEKELDSYDDNKARILCKYDTLNFYSYSEYIEKNYVFIPGYDEPGYEDWMKWLKGVSFSFLILWLVTYLIKIGFFYIFIGEKPQIKF